MEARNGEEAKVALGAAGMPADMALIDLVLPGTSGRELGELLSAEHPGLKVIYTSGYTDDQVVRRMGMDPHAPFLQKPVTAMALLKKVREVAGSE